MHTTTKYGLAKCSTCTCEFYVEMATAESAKCPRCRKDFATVALEAFMKHYPDHFRNGTEGAAYCWRVADLMMEAE